MQSIHHHEHRHLGWDAATPAAAEVAPGDDVEVVLEDAFGGQLTALAGPEDVLALDLSAANPLTGPIDVMGAAPGDVLAIDLVEVEVGTIGWTALIPGFGLLADEFPDPHVVVSTIGDDVIRFGDIARLPTRPFLGTVGLAPAAPGPHSVIPPRQVGGNLDCRDVRAGARLLLPVEVAGARFSAGDAHGAQGDGEVCGTAIETTARAHVRLSVTGGRPLGAPRLELPAERRASGAEPRTPERTMTMGVGPDLMAGARDATRRMIEVLVDRGVAAPDAYALCSVAGNLRIVEVVDVPNWVVGLELDLGVLV
ncbi:MAG: acetamidase/formamidase family protein [Nitriliruptoraceae bacterium]